MDKINVLVILRDHFSTFRRFDTGKKSLPDFLIFLGVPLLIAIVLPLQFHFSYNSTVLNALLAGFSIFAGLLLNLLVLICGFAGNEKFTGFDAASTNRRKFLREIHQNLSFAILNSIVAVVVAIIGLCRIWYLNHEPDPQMYAYPIISFAMSFLIANFVLTLLMLLKRIHLLLSAEFAGPRNSQRAA